MKVHYNDSNLAVATWRDIQLQLFTGTMLASHILPIQKARAELAAQHPGGVYAITVISSIVGLPDGPTRDGSVGMLRYLSKSSRASAYVIEGTSLRASAMRSFVSVMLMASRPAHPTNTFSDAMTAIDWLRSAGHRCQAPADEFLQTILQLRTQHSLARQGRSAG